MKTTFILSPSDVTANRDASRKEKSKRLAKLCKLLLIAKGRADTRRYNAIVKLIAEME